MEDKITRIAVIGHGSNKNDFYDHINKFNKELNRSIIAKSLEESFGITYESLNNLSKSISEVINPIFDSFITAGFTAEEIIKLIKNSEKSSPILLKTIVLKKSSKKPYKQRRYKRFKNHR